MTTKEQAARRAGFYADLRSGNFIQAVQAMRRQFPDGTREHCCLGVAQERYQNDLGEAADSRDDILTAEFLAGTDKKTSIGVLSVGARDYYGFDYTDPIIGTRVNEMDIAATEANDLLKKDFSEIADMFEEMFPAVANE